MSITEALLRPLLTMAAGRPLITHYDDAAGTRVELSVATMANWAAKTANWLADDLDVQPGSPVAVLLPAHWQTAAVLLGAWWCGAHVTSDPAGATLAVVPPSGSAPGAHAVAVASLDPMGRDLGPATDTLDYIAESRLHADDFLALTPVPGTTPALCGTPVDDVVATARIRAAALGLTPGSRVLSTRDWTLPDGLTDSFLAVLAGAASLVLVTNPDPAKLPTHRSTERTTIELT
ncbi:MAG TPA: TIGR03089 family protein [Actinophytocola sp.]|uniref:TIGR03089 family protein n=1 Tax=Actinophytocola sp. TaxID=1872138 RepID=UPI002DDD9D63|nr:TIGR03089 family protein [Actinophytocola sp.]HEV2784713.1 TIGR03089 family protein [Actinophytocola sp.]